MIAVDTRPSSVRDWRVYATCATVLVAALGLWFLLFDYGFGYGDQDEFLPYLLHTLDDRLFVTDWYVQTQLDRIGVRTYFVFALRTFCIFVSPEVAVAVVFTGCWLAIAACIARITVHLGGGIVATLVSVPSALCFTPKWTLGGNDLVYTMLVPEMAAWALVLSAFVPVDRGRFVLAGILLGVAAWFQLLAGVLAAALFCLVLLVRRPGRIGIRNAFLLGFSTLVAALPILIPVGIQQFGSTETADLLPSGLFILAEFRAPHHYLPSFFSTGSWARFSLLVLLGLPASRWLGRRRLVESEIPMVHILLGVGGMCLASWFFTEVVPVALIVKLQIFKVTVLAKTLLIIAVAIGLENLVVRAWSRTRVQTGRVLIAIPIIAIMMAGSVYVWHETSSASRQTSTPSWRAPGLEAWARSDTRREAVFATPPSISSFRTFARRAMVVNYAAVPFAPEDLAEWYRRLQAVAPIATRVPDRDLVQRLDSSFQSLGTTDWIRLADTYGIDYLVRRADANGDLPFRVVYRDTAWTAYQLDPVPASDAG